MSTERLSELSKPVAWTTREELIDAGAGAAFVWKSARGLNDEFSLYSQEYVSALLAELEAKDKRIAELAEREKRVVALANGNDELWEAMAHRLKTLEDKLATPVRFPEDLAQKIKVTGYYEALNEMMDCVRAAGFKCAGDE